MERVIENIHQHLSIKRSITNGRNACDIGHSRVPANQRNQIIRANQMNQVNHVT